MARVLRGEGGEVVGRVPDNLTRMVKRQGTGESRAWRSSFRRSVSREVVALVLLQLSLMPPGMGA